MPSPVPLPLPVSFGPHEADWWAVAVTALGAIASLIVAIAALLSAREAKRVAHASEGDRMRQLQREYELRMEDAVASFLVGTTEFMKNVRTVKTHAKPPMMDPVVSAIQVPRLRARGDDARVFAAIADDLSRLSKVAVALDLYNGLASLVIKVREWRSGEHSASEMLAWLAGRGRM